MLIGYDSTRPALIPAHAQVIFYYGDGRYKWSEADLARFPTALRREISATGEADAMIDDVEKGDLTPQDMPARIRKWNAERPGQPKVVNCSRSALAGVQAACHGLEYRVWLATLDDSTPWHYSGAGIVAIQTRDVGGRYDRSLVRDTSWLRRPHPR